MPQAIALSTLNLIQPITCRRGRKAKTTKNDVPSNGGAAGFGVSSGGKLKEPLWQCIKMCGACCKLDKGPNFATPEEIFDSSTDVQLYRSLIGQDGWCIHFDKSSRTCSIYSDRPYFCRVEPHVFQTLYGIQKRKFNKEACSFCKDTIKTIYGAHSEELMKFDRAIRSEASADC